MKSTGGVVQYNPSYFPVKNWKTKESESHSANDEDPGTKKRRKLSVETPGLMHQVTLPRRGISESEGWDLNVEDQTSKDTKKPNTSETIEGTPSKEPKSSKKKRKNSELEDVASEKATESVEEGSAKKKKSKYSKMTPEMIKAAIDSIAIQEELLRKLLREEQMDLDPDTEESGVKSPKKHEKRDKESDGEALSKVHKSPKKKKKLKDLQSEPLSEMPQEPSENLTQHKAVDALDTTSEERKSKKKKKRKNSEPLPEMLLESSTNLSPNKAVQPNALEHGQVTPNEVLKQSRKSNLENVAHVEETPSEKTGSLKKKKKSKSSGTSEDIIANGKHELQDASDIATPKKPRPIKPSKMTPEMVMDAIEKRRTVSVAIPGTILRNFQKKALRTYVSCQIARAIAIYKVDEIIIYDDECGTTSFEKEEDQSWRCCVFLGRILQYLECPQYLRGHLFPMSDDYKFVGLATPLDCAHHLRISDISKYREGVIVADRPMNSSQSYADVGLRKKALVNAHLNPGTRVTVKLHFTKEDKSIKDLTGDLVSPQEPFVTSRQYWGYSIRLAKSLTKVINECPYKEGYDLLIGTSDKGQDVKNVSIDNHFHHGLIVFGGVTGIEKALENDPKAKTKDPQKLFNYYLNTCRRQGVRTIRTEEALLISLAHLSDKLASVKRE